MWLLINAYLLKLFFLLSLSLEISFLAVSFENGIICSVCCLFQKRKEIDKMPSNSTSESLSLSSSLIQTFWQGWCDTSMGTLLMSLPWKRKELNLKLVCVDQIMTFYKTVTFYQHCQRTWKECSFEESSTCSHHAYTNILIFLPNHKHAYPQLHTHLHKLTHMCTHVYCHFLKTPGFQQVPFLWDSQLRITSSFSS